MSNPDPKSNPASETPANPKKSSRFLTRLCVIGAVGLLTLGALALAVPWGCYRYHHVVVSEATVRGTVTRIGARIDGRIKSIEVEAGQRVAKGDVLLRMEDRHMVAALERARAELQSARKDLDIEKLGIAQTHRRLTLDIERVEGTRKKEMGQLQAQESNLTRLQKQYDRVADLLRKGAAAPADMDKITGDRDRALALVSAAKGDLETVESNYQKALNELEGVNVRKERLGVLESQIAVAKARVAVAEADLDATVITAPEDGRVLERIVEIGGSAKVGEPMISLWIGRAWVEAWTDERDLRKIKIGSAVDVSLDASPNRKLPGRVEAIGFVTDKQLQASPVPSTLRAFVRQNAMVPIRIALEEDNSRIQLGNSALVGIKKEAETPAAERARLAHSSRSAGPSPSLTRITIKE